MVDAQYPPRKVYFNKRDSSVACPATAIITDPEMDTVFCARSPIATRPDLVQGGQGAEEEEVVREKDWRHDWKLVAAKREYEQGPPVVAPTIRRMFRPS